MNSNECGPCSDAKQRTTKPLIPCSAISNLFFICQLCTGRDAAVKFCLHCKSLIGKCCAKSHRSIIPWSKHTVLSLPNALHCSPDLSNQLYLYCVQCKLLLCSEDLAQAHLSYNHDIETLDCVYEERIKDLKKVQIEIPQRLKECKSIKIDVNDRPNKSEVEILYSRSGRPNSSTDDVFNNRRLFGDGSEFCKMYLHYWNAIMSNKEAEMMEGFIKFLNDSFSAVLSCQNRDSLLVFAPMLIHSIENPECFASSLRNRSSQVISDSCRTIEQDANAAIYEPKDISSTDINPCQMLACLMILVNCIALAVAVHISQESYIEALTRSIIGHPTDEGSSDRTPQQEREVLDDAILYRNHDCHFENVNDES